MYVCMYCGSVLGLSYVAQLGHPPDENNSVEFYLLRHRGVDFIGRDTCDDSKIRIGLLLRAMIQQRAVRLPAIYSNSAELPAMRVAFG